MASWFNSTPPRPAPEPRKASTPVEGDRLGAKSRADQVDPRESDPRISGFNANFLPPGRSQSGYNVHGETARPMHGPMIRPAQDYRYGSSPLGRDWQSRPEPAPHQAQIHADPYEGYGRDEPDDYRVNQRDSRAPSARTPNIHPPSAHSYRAAEPEFVEPEPTALQRIGQIAASALLALLGATLLISILFHHSADPSWNVAAFEPGPGETGADLIRNPMGKFGARASDLLLQLFGWNAAFMALFVMAAGMYRFRRGFSRNAFGSGKAVIAVLAILALAPVLAGFAAPPSWNHASGLGGVFGDITRAGLALPFDSFGLPASDWIATFLALAFALPGLSWASGVRREHVEILGARLDHWLEIAIYRLNVWLHPLFDRRPPEYLAPELESERHEGMDQGAGRSYGAGEAFGAEDAQRVSRAGQQRAAGPEGLGASPPGSQNVSTGESLNGVIPNIASRSPASAPASGWSVASLFGLASAPRQVETDIGGDRDDAGSISASVFGAATPPDRPHFGPRTGGRHDLIPDVTDIDDDDMSLAGDASSRANPVQVKSPPDKAKTAKAPAPKRAGQSEAFSLPPLDLLAPAPPRQITLDEAALLKRSDRLRAALEEFRVRGDIVEIRPGPVVTLFEFEPAPGVRTAQVMGVAEDIARSMGVASARVAIVPGRNAIGIELPNEKRETVSFRELLSADNFQKSDAALPLALGETIGGEPFVADLARMPHLLIAGTTGSGKSVGINAMILSLLYRLTPEQCRFIMVDPKMLELSVYQGTPHLLAPVVTDPHKAVAALKWVVREMEERYLKMSLLSVRNLAGYNEKAGEARRKGVDLIGQSQKGVDAEGQPIVEAVTLSSDSLPFIVVVIDEMADLMLVAGKEIEMAVQRLAQMARAAGIHLIMATQRPSVDVITGTIKANFPCRISFNVASKIDSRTILNEQGAEQLLGQGDMLFLPGSNRLRRLHGPFVSDMEVNDVVNHLRSQGTPKYLEEVTATPEEGADNLFGDTPAEGDELYRAAVRIVARDRKASTSYIQRKLNIGYNRAAKLIERMEEDGYVGPPNHTGKREIYLPETHDEEE